MDNRPVAVCGLWWDVFTPAVEGQITRDIIALQSQGAVQTQLMVVCRDNSADRLLDALGVKRSVAHALASLWITYRTGEKRVEAPEHAETVIERDLHVNDSSTQLDPTPKPGYYMRPQGRIKAPSNILQRPMPIHNGQTDPMIVLLWSSTKASVKD